MYVTITPVSRSTWPTVLSAMKGDDQRDERHHLHREDHDHERRLAVEAVSRERERREEREHERSEHDAADHDQAVPDVVPEVRPPGGVGVRERRPLRHPLRLVAEHVDAELEAVDTIQ